MIESKTVFVLYDKKYDVYLGGRDGRFYSVHLELASKFDSMQEVQQFAKANTLSKNVIVCEVETRVREHAL